MVKVISEKEIHDYKIFKIKSIDLEFSNSQKKTYYIVEKKDSSILVPITNDNKIIMIKEYCAGVNDFRLGLPKGTIDSTESSIETANKEFQEEAGYKANKIIYIGKVDIAPGNIKHFTHIYLGLDLEKSFLVGDEDEEIEVIKVPFDKFEDYIENGTLSEARVISALYLTKNYFKKKEKTKGA